VIYIVSGFTRSGTSMMMYAIFQGATSGGIVSQPDFEKLNFKGHDGYKPNPEGLWEVGQRNYFNAHFLRNIPDESFIKIFFDGLPCLPKRDYIIIYMHRDEEEIKASLARVERHIEENSRTESSSKLGTQPHTTFSVYGREYNQENIDHVIGICEARSDINLIQLNYKDVVTDPLTAFEMLANAGLPIDPAICASTIDSDYYRFKS